MTSASTLRTRKEQIKPDVNRRKKIIKIGAEINEINMNNVKKRIVAEMKKVNVTIDSTDIKSIIVREYY